MPSREVLALDEVVRLQALVARMRTAIVNAALHVEELRDAWERGIIDEHDGRGGTRSNRNMEVVLELKAALAAAEEVTDAADG